MAEDDSGADLLWTTRNAFYVGAYQAAIADAADLEGLDDATALERDAFVFRCYVELGSHEVRTRRRRKPNRSIARLKKKKTFASTERTPFSLSSPPILALPFLEWNEDI